MTSVKVIVDANALMMPFQFRIDLESELKELLGAHEIIVPSSVIRELESLAKTSLKARAALKLASRYRILDVRGRGDAAIIRIAAEHDAVVVTNDRWLRRRLRDSAIPVVYLRGRGRLELDGTLPR